jgi:hypothetical protein
VCSSTFLTSKRFFPESAAASALEVLVLGGASVISTSAMFADELCGGGTTGSRMEKNGPRDRVDCKGGAGCECLMATHKCRQLLQQRRLETRKLGSEPNPPASDPDLDKIRCAAVIGAIGHVGRNCQTTTTFTCIAPTLDKAFVSLVSASEKDIYYTSVTRLL